MSSLLAYLQRQSIKGNNRTIDSLSSDEYFKKGSVPTSNLTVLLVLCNKLSSTLLRYTALYFYNLKLSNISIRHFVVVTFNFTVVTINLVECIQRRNNNIVRDEIVLLEVHSSSMTDFP